MFRCQKCGSTSAPNEKQHTIVVESREKKYRNHEGNTFVGWEIVTEKKVCGLCVPPKVVSVKS